MFESALGLGILLALSLPISLLYTKYLHDAGITAKEFWLHYATWCAVTAAAFLTFNFWLFIIAAAGITYKAAKATKQPYVLWIAIVFALPVISRRITGLGLAQQLFAIDYVRVLALAILLPLAVQLYKSREYKTAPSQYVDIAIVGYIAIQLVLRISIDSFTNTLRYAFYVGTDIGLPYYVASRAINDSKSLKTLIYTLWFACLILSTIAIFEAVSGKLLYESLQKSLNQYWGYGHTLLRGETMRAQAATGQPIALGYVMMVGLTAHCFVAGQNTNVNLTRALGMLLVAGLIASISRGPWIGAAVAIVTYFTLSAKAFGAIAKLGVGAIACISLIASSPWADTVAAHLPFIGTVETHNITYRENLLNFSMQIIAQNPFFGAYDYLYHPALQSLRQESQNGLIDVVNTYVGIALANGLVGLGFFLAAFLIPAYTGWQTMRQHKTVDGTERNIGRALLAAIAGTLVTILTTSSITTIPTLYWTIIGLTVAYSGMKTNWLAQGEKTLKTQAFSTMRV